MSDSQEGKMQSALEVETSRTDMTIFHFVMTIPRWSISLFFFLAATSCPLASPYDSIVVPITRLRTLVSFENVTYQQCAADSVNWLQQRIELAAEAELKRVQDAQTANNLQLAEAQNLFDMCSEDVNQALAVVRQWESFGFQIQFMESQTCTPSMKQQVSDIIHDEYQVVGEEISSLWDNYIEESVGSANSLQTYAEKRFHYDYEYFVGLRIQPALIYLRDLLQYRQPFNVSVDSQAIEEQFVAVLAEMQLVLEHANEQFDLLLARLDTMKQSVIDFKVAYDDLYDRLVQGALFVTDLLPPGTPLPEFFELEGIPLATALLPSLEEIDLVAPDISRALELLTNTTQICMGILQTTVERLELQSQIVLGSTLESIHTHLIQLLNLDDYNPPTFVAPNHVASTMDEQVSLLSNLSAHTKSKSSQLFDQMLAIASNQTLGISANVSYEYNVTQPTESGTRFDYLQPTLPSMPFPHFLQMFLVWFFTNTWAVEIILQALRLWRLEGTYRKGGFLDMPELNYGGGSETKPDACNTRSTICKEVSRSFFAPRILLTTVLGPIFLVGIGVWYPYVKGVCIDTSDGTFLANHVFLPMLVNEANLRGNLKYFDAQQQCFATHRSLCQQHQSQTLARFHSDVLAFNELQWEFEEAVNVVLNMTECIDPQVGLDIESSCCGLKGHRACLATDSPGVCPFDHQSLPKKTLSTLSHYLSTESCLPEQWSYQMDDAVFNCDTLSEVCHQTPCKGVDQESLRGEIVRTDCELELYVVKLVRFILTALYHAAAINLVCTLLFNGTRQLFWRRLCPEGVRFRGMLRENGTLVRGGNQQERADNIAEIVSRFESAAKVQIIIGSLVCFGWMLSGVALAIWNQTS